MPTRQSKDTDSDLKVLVDLVQSGDRRAMDTLYLNMYPKLFTYVLHMVGRDHAEDVINETMLQVWKHIDDYDALASKVSTWIIGFARNYCLKQHQRDSAMKRRALSFVDQQTLERTSDKNNFDLSQNSGTLQMLEQLVTELSSEHRNAILLIAEGYTYQEIGEIEGCPEGTAKTRVMHARKRLKHLVAQRSSDGYTREACR